MSSLHLTDLYLFDNSRDEQNEVSGESAKKSKMLS